MVSTRANAIYLKGNLLRSMGPNTTPLVYVKMEPSSAGEPTLPGNVIRLMRRSYILAAVDSTPLVLPMKAKFFAGGSMT